MESECKFTIEVNVDPFGVTFLSNLVAEGVIARFRRRLEGKP